VVKNSFYKNLIPIFTNKVKKQERYAKVLEYFSMQMPEPKTELVYKSPYELIVAVILSAQCTDKRVNIITPAFFQKFPDAITLSEGTFEEVMVLIQSCSYPNNKAKNLIGMAKSLVNDFGNKVPSTVEALQLLPGIGRKSANVIASVVYNKPAMAVDTHVFRVSARIGLTTGARNPLQAEMQLIKHIPTETIADAHHWLILHGRYVCTARKPQCEKCGISDYCRFFQNEQKKLKTVEKSNGS